MAARIRAYLGKSRLFLLVAIAACCLGAQVPSAFGYGWIPISTPATQAIAGVSFTSADNGWFVCSNAALFHTTDGGSSWTTVTISTPNTVDGIRFADAQNGWITADTGTIFHTANGGSTWETQTPPFVSSQKRPFALDALHAWIPEPGSSGKVLRTVDGGATWLVGTTGDSTPMQAVSFCDALHGWAGGLNGALYRTVDGGQTWSPTPVPRFTRNVSAISAVDSETAVAVTTSSDWVELWDRGSSWTTGTVPGVSFTSIAYVDVGELVASGWGKILYSRDWGATWSAVATSPLTGITDVSMLDAATGYAACDNGVLLKYNPPAAPVAHSVEATDAFGIVTTWSPAPDAVEYQFQDGGGGGGTYTGSPLRTDYNVYFAAPGVKTLRVRAVTAEGMVSEWSTATVTNHALPLVISNISAPPAVTTTSVHVSWSAVSGALHYEYRVAGGSPVQTDDTSATLALTLGDNVIEVRAKANMSIGPWKAVHVAYALPKKAVSIARTPTATTLTYKRKRGVAKFTLKARLTSLGKPVASALIRLQTSSNGKTWNSWYSLKTNSSGIASKAFAIKKKSTRYYRWYALATANQTSGYSSKQKVIVK